jgi:DHA1 family bicyclomycin/chloramphenicol resistance-like MFS transporter
VKEFIVLMASLMSIVAISIDAMLPALGVMGPDLNITHPNQAQLIISLIFLGLMAGQLIAGSASDALGRKKVLFAGLGVYIVGSLVCYLSQDIAPMLAGRFIQGLGVSAPYVCAIAIVRDKYAGRDMARIMSIIMVFFMLVPAVAPSIGQAVLNFGTWHTIFVMYICLAAALGAWCFFRLEETLHPEDKIKFSLKNLAHGFGIVVRTRLTMCYTIAMGICFGSLIGYLTSSQQIFQVMFGTGETFTLYFGALALVLGAASLLNARIVKKYGMRRICYASSSCIVAASAVFLMINLTLTVELWMFMAYASVLFFSFGVMFGNLNAIAMEPMGHIAGVASAVTGAMSSLLSVSLGTLIGQLYNGTLIPLTIGFLVLNLISLALMKAAGESHH